MKTTIRIFNERTKNYVDLSGKLTEIYAGENIIRIRVKSTVPDLFAFELEAYKNETKLKELGVDTDSREIAYRHTGDLSETFRLPSNYGVSIEVKEE